jgi:hypothetical protein
MQEYGDLPAGFSARPGWIAAMTLATRLNPSMFLSTLASSYIYMSSAALLYCNGGCPGVVSYFGVHEMTKELQGQRQK